MTRRHRRSALGLLLAALVAGAAAQPRVEVQALFKDRAMLLVDGKRRLLTVGETSPEGVTLLGADARGARVRVDGSERRLALGSRIGSDFKGPREQRLRVVGDSQGIYAAPGAINGTAVRFVVDTGATLVSINEPLARRLQLDYRRGTPGESVTASGVVPIWRLRVARVSVGDIELNDVEVAVHQGAFPPRPLLGNSFLSRIEMERSGNEMLLRRTF